MKKSILRIVTLLLVIGLNWTGLLAIGRTIAYFNDTETVSGSTFSAGTLDFSLDTPGDFSLNFTSYNPAIRNISIINQGSLLFQYTIEGTDFSGPLCDYLDLEASLDGETKYTGPLTSFASSPVNFSEPDNWQFVFTFSGDQFEHIGEWCLFDFAFKGWQDNISDYESSGFKDEEIAFTRITIRQEKTVVLNEILADPVGEDCSLEGLQGEWVEIYNNSDIEVDLYGWYIENSEGDRVTIDSSNTMGGSTLIGPKGSGSEWLVVFLNGCILNNNGDAVFLYHSAGSLADSYSYFGIFPEDKSFARYPDGTGPWYDPIPTPGGPNRLEPFGISDLFAVGGTSGQEEEGSKGEDLVGEEAPVGGEEAGDGEEAGEETTDGIIADGVDGSDGGTENTEGTEMAETNEAIGETSGENTDTVPTADSTEVNEPAGVGGSSEGSESSEESNTIDGNEGGSIDGGESSDGEEPATVPNNNNSSNQNGNGEGDGGDDGGGDTDGADGDAGDTDDSPGEGARESSGNNGDAGDSVGNSAGGGVSE